MHRCVYKSCAAVAGFTHLCYYSPPLRCTRGCFAVTHGKWWLASVRIAGQSAISGRNPPARHHGSLPSILTKDCTRSRCRPMLLNGCVPFAMKTQTCAVSPTDDETHPCAPALAPFLRKAHLLGAPEEIANAVVGLEI